MSGTIQASVVKDSASATNNLTLDTSGNVAVGNSLTVAGTQTTTGTVVMGSSFLRNRIINGNMTIDQRNGGAAVTQTTANLYVTDRFLVGGSVTTKFTAQQSTTVPNGYKNSLVCTSSSAYSVGASETFVLSQRIEGYNVLDLGWGAAGAQTVTISFWVRSSLTGTFGGSLRNSAQDRSYPFSYAISLANTWEQKSITIAGDTSGTWLTDSGIGINLTFSLGTGATLSATAGAWAAGNYISATGAVSVVGTSGATFYLTGVQLEVGSVATPFERRQYGQELMLCQRYYQTVSDMMVQGYIAAGGTIYNDFPLAVPMRATPTGAFTGSWTYSGASTAALNSATSSKFRLSVVITATSYGYAFGNPITFSAEL